MFSLTPLTRVLAVSPWLLMLLMLGGCQQEKGITTYSIPTTVPIQLRVGNERMLAAMVPHGDLIWFFKVTGPEAAIEGIATEFKQFVSKIEFEGSNPKLTELPEGWQKAGEKEMRFASIDISTPEKQLDLSISNLQRSGDWDEQVAMNVNRWRGQLSLPASSEKWAEGEPFEVTSSDGKSVWVDLVGKAGGGASMSGSPPFAAMSNPPNGAIVPPMAPPSSAPADKPPIDFEMPAGWREGNKTSMRWAAFNVGPDDAAAEMTVMPAGGDLRNNVARWIGQIRPSGVADSVVDEAMAAVQKIVVDGRPSQRFLLVGEEPESGTAIDATIIPLEGESSLFVKMTGPVKTVRGESDAIAEFLKSLKL